MDCIEGMKLIPDGSVDCIICDPPYGTTRNEWDAVIPLDELWAQYKRIAKPNAAIVLFSQQPFTSVLVQSNLRQFRYEWIWQKNNGTGFLNANKMPLKVHENILLFYDTLPTYNPQYTKGKPYKGHSCGHSSNYGHYNDVKLDNDGKRCPIDVIDMNVETGLHPTQKPVNLIRRLIAAYSNPGDTILDNCMGSGTTAVAAIREKRHFIGFELDKGYFDKACRRIRAEQAQLTLF